MAKLKQSLKSILTKLIKTVKSWLLFPLLCIINFKRRCQCCLHRLVELGLLQFKKFNTWVAAFNKNLFKSLKKLLSKLKNAWAKLKKNNKQTVVFSGNKSQQSKNQKQSFLNRLYKIIKNFFYKLKKRLNLRLPKIFQKQNRIFLKISPARILAKKYRGYYVSVIVTMVIFGFSWWIYDFVFKDLPSPTDLTERRQIMTTRILDRNGSLLFRIYEDENRTIVPLEEIPQHMINATIAIEDRGFYNHHGFSVRGIFRAIAHNLRESEVQGGSTITQQLVKNRLLDSEQTIKRKLREMVLAILVEATYSKDEILEMYLNEVAYGGITYGIEETAWQYFNKPARELTLGESAMLAGLTAAPSVYTPFGPNPELSVRRQEEVLRRMLEDGYITLEEAYLAQQEELELRKNIVDIQAPHFVMYVKKILEDKFGKQVLYQGGLEVRTSLDLNLQYKAEEIVTQEIEKVRNFNISNGAALVTNPQTGEILAMVGSKDYFDFEHDGQVNVAIRPRQPGSSIKPLTYALAFESGKKPWSYVDDSPITYHIPGSRPYSPRNYDGRFRGRVTLRQALAGSYNVPAVKTLASLGVSNLVEKGREMGITTWEDSSRFGLSLTLGAGEVLMTDLSEVYGTFSTGGYTIELDPFLEIRGSQGKVLYRNQCFDDPDSCWQQQTLDPLAAYRVTDVLSDNNARAQTFGLYSLLHIPDQQVAVKTGTTNNMRDNWTIGYTSNRLVSVWVGNNDNSSMSRVASGMTGASPIWNQIMRLLLNPEQPHQFALPPDFTKVSICVPTETLTCSSCPHVTQEIFRQGEEPENACNWQYFAQPDEADQPPPGERSQIL